MKYLILISTVAFTLFIFGCKKEAPPPPNPHAGVKMDAAQGDPHAGIKMDASKGDPHAGMEMNKGMAGMLGAPTPSVKAEISSDGEITVGSLRGKLPAGWKSVPPASAMRLAQIELPPAAGDPEPGELTVFFLGSSAGGIEANIDRWCAQFTQPDGRPTKDVAIKKELKIGELQATLVQFSGTMAPSSMPGSPQTGSKENWMNLSAIVSTPEGPFFFKGTGPIKTMKGQEKALQEFVSGLKFGK